MTKEQLDAIRARVEAGHRHPGCCAVEARENLRTLLAEVERLTADPLPAAAWVREVERAAFARGVAAMREAAVEVASKRANLPKHSDLDSAWCRSAECILDELRHLPDPEDKP